MQLEWFADVQRVPAPVTQISEVQRLKSDAPSWLATPIHVQQEMTQRMERQERLVRGSMASATSHLLLLADLAQSRDICNLLCEPLLLR